MAKPPQTAAPPPKELELDPSVGNVYAVAELHAKAELEVDKHQRRIETVTAALGRPRTLYGMLAVVVVWIGYNVAAPALRLPRFDPPPFMWLESVVGLMALLMTTMVLTTQNRQGKLAARRALLDLHVNLMSEQKVAKLIALLEELRRDMPSVDNRHDPQAEVMSQPMDPHSTIAKIEASIEKAIISQATSSPGSAEDSAAADLDREAGLEEGLRERVAEVTREADKAGPPSKVD